jgi:pyrimidine-nucleoside phosphorylase
LRPQDVIRKKRDGAELSREEIMFFVGGVTTGDFADYQAAALLMAIFLRGLSQGEQQELTECMLHSGEVLDFSDIPRPKADKHSTGGVGDKTSLIVAPLAAASGICVPMISGRGLGHTGGTLDKLEAIPGFRVDLSLAKFRSIVERVGYAMIGQTTEIVPADKILYGLRDATATIEAVPLIVASIMSKKLASGLDALVLDVKTGSGAFMQDEEHAGELARALVSTGNSCGVRTEALITDMNQPLGSAVGNALEVKECIDILRGEVRRVCQPVLSLSLELASRMVRLSRPGESLDEARRLVQRSFDSGAALECFRASVEAQGGDPRVCDRPALLVDPSLHQVEVTSPRTGVVAAIDAAEIGRVVVAIGGGRTRMTDSIDPAVGFLAEARLGDSVTGGATLGLLLCREADKGNHAAERIRSAYKLAEEPLKSIPRLIKEVIS